MQVFNYTTYRNFHNKQSNLLYMLIVKDSNNCKIFIFDTIFENFTYYGACSIIVFESNIAYQDKRESFGGSV